VIVKAAGCATVALVVAVQPFASVTVTEYGVVEADKFEIAAVVAVYVPGPVHAYVYGAVPKIAFTPVEPSDKPLQETSVVDVIVAINPIDGSVNVEVVVVIHPFASITFTVYVPAVLPEITFAV
jgi:hypothetical protein